MSRLTRVWALSCITLLALSCSGAPTEIPREPVTMVVIEPDAATINAGSTVTFRARAVDNAGNEQSDRRIFWASSDESIASVNGSGVVRGERAGSVDIAASSEGKSAIARVTVLRRPVASVAVVPPSGEILVGRTLELRAITYDSEGETLEGRTVQWSSSAPNVASVSENGTVRGDAPGTATITATSEGQSGSASIMVRPAPVASVTVSPESVTLQVGGEQRLEARVRDADGNDLTDRAVSWSSSNTNVARVDDTGLVRAFLPGTATITATSEGHSGSATVRVTWSLVASVEIIPSTLTLRVGHAHRFQTRVLDGDGNEVTGRTLYWNSFPSSVATVNQSGFVQAISPGTATITATLDGQMGRATVTVTQ